MIHIDLRNLAQSLPKYKADPRPSALRDIIDSIEPKKYDPIYPWPSDIELENEPAVMDC